MRALDAVGHALATSGSMAWQILWALAKTNLSQVLCQHQHKAGRRVAASAIRLGIPPALNDGIFHNAPGLVLETLTTR